MLEYTYDEAMELLTKNLQAAEAKLVRTCERVRNGRKCALMQPDAFVLLNNFASSGKSFILLVGSRPRPLQAQYIEDLSFLKDQIITCEVDMARVFNWDVKTRRAKGLTGTSSSSASLASGGGNRNVPGLSQSKAEMIAEIRAAAGGGGAGR